MLVCCDVIIIISYVHEMLVESDKCFELLDFLDLLLERTSSYV